MGMRPKTFSASRKRRGGDLGALPLIQNLALVDSTCSSGVFKIRFKCVQNLYQDWWTQNLIQVIQHLDSDLVDSKFDSGGFKI